jgi:uncharacterized protein
MTVILDTSAVLAYMTATDSFHQAAVSAFDAIDDELVTSPLVLAEMDHLVAALGGRSAAEVLWSNFESGAYAVRWWADALEETITIAREHPKLGLADASLVALADRLRTNRILTFDPRFRMLTTPHGQSLELLP